MRAFLYVDGFNLFHRRLKGTAFKWLDLYRLGTRLLPPDHRLEGIRYFTATVNALPWNLRAPQRQEAYIRALTTSPHLTVHRGQFKTREKWMPLVTPCPSCGDKAHVWSTSEKGSDVNLAAHVLVDAKENRYDVAWLITMDSDLSAAVNAARHAFGKKVGIIIPKPKGGRHLFRADYFENIRDSALAQAQFPVTLADSHGQILKPKDW